MFSDRKHPNLASIFWQSKWQLSFPWQSKLTASPYYFPFNLVLVFPLKGSHCLITSAVLSLRIISYLSCLKEKKGHFYMQWLYSVFSCDGIIFYCSRDPALVCSLIECNLLWQFMNCQMNLSNSKLPFDLHLVLMKHIRTKLKPYLGPFSEIRYLFGGNRWVSGAIFFFESFVFVSLSNVLLPIFLMELSSQLDIIQLQLPNRQNGNEIVNNRKQVVIFWCCFQASMFENGEHLLFQRFSRLYTSKN